MTGSIRFETPEMWLRCILCCGKAKGKERKGKGKERKGKEKERKGKERKGKERKGERKGKGKERRKEVTMHFPLLS